MGCPGGWPGAALARLLLLLGLPALCSAGEAVVGAVTLLRQQDPAAALTHRGSPAGLGPLGPTIDGQPLAVCTLREEESRAFTCRAPRPAPGAALAWYLDGRKQEANCSAAGAASTLTLTARRTDHELNCSLVDTASGETHNASVLLDVQSTAGQHLSPVQTCLTCAPGEANPAPGCAARPQLLPVPPPRLTACVCCPDKPEILRADAHYREVEGAGLLLLLSVLVQANPPASVTWVDQDGLVMANASEFLLLGATRYPGLANHSLRVHLGGTAGNFSVSAANSVGVTTASLLPPGLLDTRVELPLLGVAIGAALALSALLSLGSCAACLACHRAEPVPGKGQAGGSSPLHQGSCVSSFEHPQPRAAHLLRQTRSLPPDLRLGDLAPEAGASPRAAGAGARRDESALPGLENPVVLSFIQLPGSGRIYKVPSVSSDEIWL
ncbi:LOW QUALITY PROTEIN: transmembrane protein 25 [Nyctibius grandis]|uniref:LOW QUALITY PROTEIN: transmembrane protein 25 n=1 Tax=Nyctibius grandis TaxID=48427 RepID=UPI0035BC1539